MESTIAAVNVKYTHWKLIMELEDSPMSKELPQLTTGTFKKLVWPESTLKTIMIEIEKKIAAAEHSLQFLDQTIVIVEANRKKFEHIDQVAQFGKHVFISAHSPS